MHARISTLWFWLYAAAVAGLLLCGAARAAEPGPQIKVQVDGDQIVLVVRSKVQFTVWSSVNPVSVWWPVYTSPHPALGTELVWVAINSKAGVFPDWCFWRVTAAKPVLTR